MGKDEMLSNKLFANPKVLASSGLLAMIPKSIIAAGLAIALYCLLSKNFFLCFFFLYPVIGTIFDIILYVFRDKIWSQVPDLNFIPEDWETSPEQLFQFAKQLPKVRLMRFVGCVLILPLIPLNKDFVLSSMVLWILIGYFIFALFDRVWIKVFKLKIPGPTVTSSSDSSYETDDSTYAWWRPGTTAWHIKQLNDRVSGGIDSMNRR